MFYSLNSYRKIRWHQRPFNLHPIFSFQKMGAFATLKKQGRIQPEKNLGFIKVNQKKNWVPAHKNIWVVATLCFLSSCPRKSQVPWHPQNHFPGCRLKGCRILIGKQMKQKFLSEKQRTLEFRSEKLKIQKISPTYFKFSSQNFLSEKQLTLEF